MPASVIDPEELPFTLDEIERAGQRFLPAAAAREMAEHLAQCGPALVAERARRRTGWQRAGVPNAEDTLLHGWVYPADLLDALASLSPELAIRVEVLRRRLVGDGRDCAG